MGHAAYPGAGPVADRRLFGPGGLLAETRVAAGALFRGGLRRVLCERADRLSAQPGCLPGQRLHGVRLHAGHDAAYAVAEPVHRGALRTAAPLQGTAAGQSGRGAGASAQPPAGTGGRVAHGRNAERNRTPGSAGGRAAHLAEQRAPDVRGAARVRGHGVARIPHALGHHHDVGAAAGPQSCRAGREKPGALRQHPRRRHASAGAGGRIPDR
ncbi:hypothetical protein D3C72_1553160 [compost metagenome]